MDMRVARDGGFAQRRIDGSPAASFAAASTRKAVPPAERAGRRQGDPPVGASRIDRTMTEAGLAAKKERLANLPNNPATANECMATILANMRRRIERSNGGVFIFPDDHYHISLGSNYGIANIANDNAVFSSISYNPTRDRIFVHDTSTGNWKFGYWIDEPFVPTPPSLAQAYDTLRTLAVWSFDHRG